MLFLRAFHDWELESATSFLDLIYSHLPQGDGCDRLKCQLNCAVCLMFVLIIMYFEATLLPPSLGKTEACFQGYCLCLLPYN